MSEFELSTDELIRWLNKKYSRHGEIEDGLAAERLKLLSSEVTAANARERPAFEAGMKKAAAMAPFNIDEYDLEQAWQQYRCQDETDWKVVSEEEAAKIDASVSTGLQEKS